MGAAADGGHTAGSWLLPAVAAGSAARRGRSKAPGTLARGHAPLRQGVRVLAADAPDDRSPQSTRTLRPVDEPSAPGGRRRAAVSIRSTARDNTGPRRAGTATPVAYRAGMLDSTETNAAVWKSDAAVAQWVATAGERERGRAFPRQMLAELLPFATHDAFGFVDLGAGTGAAARAVLDRYPKATALLAEYSPQMMEEGRRALAAYEGRYRYVEVDLGSERWPDELAGGLEAVISSLCVHHLPDDRKAGLMRDVLARLAPGAWYLSYDPVRAADPAVEDAWQRVHDGRDAEAAARRLGRSPEEQARWENHVRHIVPLEAQLDLLRAAGFEAVDVYWKELDYVIVGGRRPLR